MGIFDLFKKFANEKKVEKNILEKLAFPEIENWIEKKRKENKSKEKETISRIKEIIKIHEGELNKKIKILEDFNVKEKKEKEDVREIVNNGKKNYIEMVKNFLENLKNLETDNFNEFIKKTDKIFFDFNKASHNNYERATILIGKEMANIKKGIKTFSRELSKIHEENKSVVDFFNIISQIKLELQKIHEIDNLLAITVERELFLNKKVEEKEKEKEILNQRIEEIKKSQDYLDFLDSQRKEESLKLELPKCILELKQIIDFKGLANFFHKYPKQMEVVKMYRENFCDVFLGNKGKQIINLLDEAKLNNEKIMEKIKKIDFKLKEIEKHKLKIKKDETKRLVPKIKEILLEIENLKLEKIKEEKRRKKLKRNKEESLNLLKKDLAGFNVELVLN